MAPLPRSCSMLVLGVLLLGCDRAPEAAPSGASTPPARDASATATATATEARQALASTATVPAHDGPPPAAAVAPSRSAAVDEPVVAGAVAAPVAEGGVVDGLSIVTHTVIAPTRTGDAKEDYWTQYQVWGEITNHSSQVMESVTGNITFYDAAGAPIGIDSIGTAVKADVGDRSPGETVLAEVAYVQPGQTVPFHFMRNLAAIKGEIASHRLVPRRGTPATGPAPKVVAVDVRERVEGDGPSRKRLFEGTIRNDGEGGCRSPSAVLSFHDAAGKVAHIASFDASDDLQKVIGPGETIAFAGSVYVTGDDAWRETATIKTYASCLPIY